MLGANKRKRAFYRHLRHRCHGGGGCVQPDEEDDRFEGDSGYCIAADRRDSEVAMRTLNE
jgi:hypothetical protein